jgi:DNA-binding protein
MVLKFTANTTERSRIAMTQETNTILIGRKPTQNYILAVLWQFNNGAKKVVLKARGRAICKAVDVAQIITRRFLKDVKIANVSIDTESVQGPEGRRVNISSITIELVRE